MNRRDPRIRQTIDRITETLESANTATQTSVYDFSSRYLNPCLASLSECVSDTCAPCTNVTRERARARQRALLRSQRPEAVFDFYADWDDDLYDYEGSDPAQDAGGGSSSGGAHVNERSSLLGGWGAGELDRLLAGRPKEDQQPRRHGGMTYGTTRAGTRRGSGKGAAGLAKGERDDPNLVPTSSKFGFLERLPFKFGPRGLRYKPSAANMQEGLSQRRSGGRGRATGDGDGAIYEDDEDGTGGELLRDRTEGEALLDDLDEGDVNFSRTRFSHRRGRSGTIDSGHTDTSLSSRGDLFPSDEEDDAVMLDDEMAMALGRRNTDDLDSPIDGPSSTAASSRRQLRRQSQLSSSSRKSLGSGSRSHSSKSLTSKARSFSGDSLAVASPAIPESEEEEQRQQFILPTMEELEREEEQVRQQEAADIVRKRQEAQQLAVAKGLAVNAEDEAQGGPEGNDKGREGPANGSSGATSPTMTRPSEASPAAGMLVENTVEAAASTPTGVTTTATTTPPSADIAPSARTEAPQTSTNTDDDDS